MNSPKKVGPYQILQEIGRGGMATVYLAQDSQNNRQVVVKVLPRQFTHDPRFRGRFKREAEVVAQLKHPNIVPVYDYGEDGDTPYLAMGYMAGGTLAERIKRGRLSVEEATEILTPIASALDFAHQKGIVHRDMKPGNILFDEQGQAYLSDFGIVKLAEATQSFTGSAVVGTPAYMSPEQVKGGQIDGRTDVYGLGIVLYEMLTGDVPYDGDTPTQQLMKHVLEPVPEIRKIKPDIPPEVEAVLAQALAKKPEDRFLSAGAFTSALDNPTAAVSQDTYMDTAAIIGGTDTAVNEMSRTTINATGGPPETELIGSDYETLPDQNSGRRKFRPTPVISAVIIALCLLGATAAVVYALVIRDQDPGVVVVPTTETTVIPAVFEDPISAPDDQAPTATIKPSESDPDIDETPLPSITPKPTEKAEPTETSTPKPTRTVKPTNTPTSTRTPTPTSTPTPAPIAPVARDDSVTTQEDGSVTINIVDNDSDEDGNLVFSSASLLSNPAHGDIVNSVNGTIQYNPYANYNGPDSFEYRICDADGLCDQATVSIITSPVNDAPVANNDSYQTNQNQSLAIGAPGLLGNDSDVDNNQLNISCPTDQGHGTISCNPDGSFTYTPDPGYCGNDGGLSYTVSDNNGGTDSVNITIDVKCIEPSGSIHSISIDDNSVTRPSNCPGNAICPGAELEAEIKFSGSPGPGQITLSAMLFVGTGLSPSCGIGSGQVIGSSNPHSFLTTQTNQTETLTVKIPQNFSAAAGTKWISVKATLRHDGQATPLDEETNDRCWMMLFP